MQEISETLNIAGQLVKVEVEITASGQAENPEPEPAPVAVSRPPPEERKREEQKLTTEISPRQPHSRTQAENREPCRSQRKDRGRSQYAGLGSSRPRIEGIATAPGQ